MSSISGRTASLRQIVASPLTLRAGATGMLRWPHLLLLLAVLSPLWDRFILGRLLPAELSAYSGWLSTGVVALAAVVIPVLAIRQGRFTAALRHPVSLALGALVILSLGSVLLNRVPPLVAIAGMVFTLDALAFFYLSRMAGFTHRGAVLAIGLVLGLITLAAIIAIAQALLSPTILGLTGVVGRSGEAIRLGSIFRDPNVLGTLIGMTLPFAIFGSTRLPQRHWRWALWATAFVLALALWLTYSRGSWLGVGVGFGAVLLVLDRRALLTFLLIGILALGTAYVMPRDLLVPEVRRGETPAPAYDPFGTTTRRVGAVGEGRDLRTMFVLNALPILRDHALLGVGPGRYGGAVAWHFDSPVHERYETDQLLTRQRTVDNFWLHMLVERGVLGAGAFLAIIVLAGVPLLRAARRATGSRFVVTAGILSGAAVLSLSSGTTMLLEANATAFLLWFLLGLGTLYAGTDSAQPSVASATAASPRSAETR
jgi:hypothetical protein